MRAPPFAALAAGAASNSDKIDKNDTSIHVILGFFIGLIPPSAAATAGGCSFRACHVPGEEPSPWSLRGRELAVREGMRCSRQPAAIAASGYRWVQARTGGYGGMVVGQTPACINAESGRA